MFPKLQKCRSEDLQLETPSVCGNDETLHFNILMQFCYSLLSASVHYNHLSVFSWFPPPQ